MAAFKKLKLIKDAMSPDAIRQGLEAGRAAMQGGGMPTEEQLAALTPEQRAAYDANMAQVAAAQAQAQAVGEAQRQAQLGRHALFGEAGAYVYGDVPPAATGTPTVEESMAQTKEQLKDLLRNPLGRRRPPEADPAAAARAAADPAAQAAAERAARDAARVPYLAPDRAPVGIARLATRGGSQIEEVAAYLASSGLAARPDLVFGVSRVPDHIGGGLTRAKNRIVEWDVVHATTSPLPPATPPAAVWFDARETWVARRDGEPSVLDEDLALAYLAEARIGPEQCLGLSRFLQIEGRGGGEGERSYVVSQVAGIHAWHPDGLSPGVHDRLSRERPLPGGPVPGVHVEVLNWGAIRRAVHAATHQPAPVPSPFPYLPGSAQELLRSYLEIVGVQPADCYAAQATEDRPRDLTGVSTKGLFTMSTNRGEAQPCADGEARPRLAGGARVVVAYRDAPAYVAGRDRFAAYERDVLQAALRNGVDVRAPVERPGVLERGTLGRLVRTAENIAEFVDGEGSDDPFEKIPPYRYCWPIAA